jgi:hypothetical protein
MKGHRMFTNTPLARRFWTGLNDDHLASIGFANFAWNILERKFASLVWVAADWSQEIGELVTADLGNVSMATLFINIIKQSVTDDDRILCQATRTVAVLDGIRSDRNNLIHSFFHRDPTRLNPRPSRPPPLSSPAVISIVVMTDALLLVLGDCVALGVDAPAALLQVMFHRRRCDGTTWRTEQ